MQDDEVLWVLWDDSLGQKALAVTADNGQFPTLFKYFFLKAERSAPFAGGCPPYYYSVTMITIMTVSIAR